jgi:small-conductance mechanosensitive channel
MRTIALLLTLLLLPLAAAAQQQEAPPSVPALLDQWEGEAKEIERALELDPPEGEEISRHLETLGAQLDRIPGAKQRVEAELAPLRNQLEALGEPPEDPAAEAPQIGTERKRLTEEISRREALVKRLDQTQARAKGLETRLVNLRQRQFTDQLLSRGPSLLDASMPANAIGSIMRKARVIGLETTTRIADLSMHPAEIARLVGPLLLLAVGIFVLVKVKNRALSALLSRITPETPLSGRVAAGAGITLARLLLPAGAVAMILAGLFASGLFGGQGKLLLEGAGRGALVVIAAYALGGAFFAPSAPLLRLSVLGETDARAAHTWLILLAGIVGLDRALVLQGEEMGLAVEGLALLNIVLLALGAIALWRLMHFLRPPRPPEPDTAEPPPEDDEEAEEGGGSAARATIQTLRWIARVVAVAAPVLAILGYYAASRYAFYPFVFSGAVIGLCVLLYHIVQSLVSSVWLHGEEVDPTLARLRLIPILVGFLLFCAALPLLALIWGAAPSDLQVAWRAILQGFTIGEVTISPADFLLFLVVLLIGFFLTGRFKRLLRGAVLPYTGLDQGGRDAIAAGAGYVGIVVTLLVAVSTAGVDLSNLAIVAGALSVGIGFGLQNIVNNFVSGIILLIERPIKAGDWIELPSGMGYVKNINVRSTEVETFDRSSLFVPNSQLIAENVINWTHDNMHGRIIVKVGVEYGAEPRKVERVLLAIAKGHPLMLRRPAPYVLFRGFGADALEFEIRGILRDVNWVLNVQSDINFEIARRFREEGIGIPFRQADIAIRNPEALGEALRGAFSGGVPNSGSSHEPEGPRAKGTGRPAGTDPDGGADPDPV